MDPGMVFDINRKKALTNLSVDSSLTGALLYRLITKPTKIKFAKIKCDAVPMRILETIPGIK